MITRFTVVLLLLSRLGFATTADPGLPLRFEECLVFLSRLLPMSDKNRNGIALEQAWDISDAEVRLTIHQEELLAAALGVLKDLRVSSGTEIILRSVAESKVFPPSETWKTVAEAFPRTSYGSAEKPISLHRTDGATSQVFKTTLDGKLGYFRPVTGEEKDASLPTYLAGRMAKDLEVDAVPPGRFVSINGQLGYFSEKAPGISPSKFGHPTALLPITLEKVLLRTRMINRKRRADVEAFQFLIGNTDAASTNFTVDWMGVPWIYDFNYAFSSRLLKQDYGMSKIFGRDLPKTYSANFIGLLRERFTPEHIREEYGKYLGPGRLEALLFRRAVILKDIELRGSSAILPVNKVNLAK